MLLTDEIRALRHEIAVSNHRVHYVSPDELKLDSRIAQSGVAFLKKDRALAVNLENAVLKVQLGNKKNKDSEEQVEVEIDIYENKDGSHEYAIITATISTVFINAESFFVAPLYSQPRHDDVVEEIWLELSFSGTGTIGNGPVKTSWSVVVKEVKA